MKGEEFDSQAFAEQFHNQISDPFQFFNIEIYRTSFNILSKSPFKEKWKLTCYLSLWKYMYALFPTMDLDEKNVTEMLLPLCLALERTHTIQLVMLCTALKYYCIYLLQRGEN